MNKDEIKAKLDALGIKYDGRASEETLKSLLPEDVEVQDSDDSGKQEETDQEETQTSLLDVVSKAVVKEETQEESKQDNTIDELKSRPYGTLTRGQRELLRQNSPEYVNVGGGINAELNDRVATEKRIVKVASNNWVSLFKGKTYSFGEQDYDLLKDAQVRVKTEATKDKCCGSAEYESVPLLVKVDA